MFVLALAGFEQYAPAEGRDALLGRLANGIARQQRADGTYKARGRGSGVGRAMALACSDYMLPSAVLMQCAATHPASDCKKTAL